MGAPKYKTEEERVAARKKYQREYHARRRKEDPEFNEKQKAAMRRYDRRTRGLRTQMYEPGRPKKYKTLKEKLAAQKAGYQRAYAKFIERYRTDPEFKAKHQRRSKAWYLRNRGSCDAYNKRHRHANRDRYNQKERDRYANDPEYRERRKKWARDSLARNRAKRLADQNS